MKNKEIPLSQGERLTVALCLFISFMAVLFVVLSLRR
jgi:hypothetical protein